MSDLKFSAEEQAWRAHNFCPQCGKLLLLTTTYEPDGTVRLFIRPRNIAALSECSKCHGRWFIYEQPASVEISEVNTLFEPYKSNTMTLNNRLGRSELVRQITIHEEWSKSYEIESNQEEKSGTSMSLGGKIIPAVRVSAEQTLKESYSISEVTKQSYNDQITITVPAGVVRRVVFDYRKELRSGKLVLKREDGTTTLSYSLVVGLHLDISQDDS